jgi:hypothetical protein
MGWAAARKRQQKTINFGVENPNFRHYLPRRKRRHATIDNLNRSSRKREGGSGLNLNNLVCGAVATPCEHS